MKHAFALVVGLVLLSLCTPALAAEAPPAASTTDPALHSFLDSLNPTPVATLAPSADDWLQPVVEGCAPPPEDCGGCYACAYVMGGYCCWVCC